MSDLTPSRGVVLELREERRAMADGHVFLDEKCLLLAGEILRELHTYAECVRDLERARAEAVAALKAALARHGLDELQVHPPAEASGARLERRPRSVMGVRLLATRRIAEEPVAAPAVADSPEAGACRKAFDRLATACAALAGSAGNLERLAHEYRRSIRRARALADVLLPEIDANLADLEMRLEDLEREDAVAMRLGR
jgi:V/A-type H+-transporting ATPase subunit D